MLFRQCREFGSFIFLCFIDPENWEGMKWGDSSSPPPRVAKIREERLTQPLWLSLLRGSVFMFSFWVAQKESRATQLNGRKFSRLGFFRAPSLSLSLFHRERDLQALSLSLPSPSPADATAASESRHRLPPPAEARRPRRHRLLLLPAPPLRALSLSLPSSSPDLCLPPRSLLLWGHRWRAAEELQEATENADGRYILAKVQVNALLATGAGLKNDESKLIDFTGYPVVGNQSDMQSSGSCLNDKDNGLLTACGWDSRLEGLFYHQTAFSIPIPQIPDFIADVKKLRELRPGSLCGLDLYSELLMRFVKKSTVFLGKKDDCVDFDMTYFRSRNPDDPRLDQDILEEMEQMTLFKYGALPH